MKDNPYSKMIEIIKRQGTTSNYSAVHLAEVISPLPNLILKVNDLQIDKDNILIADSLLSSNLKKGDLLATLPVVGKQTYIIIARVVGI